MRPVRTRFARLLLPALVAAGVLLGGAAPLAQAQADGSGRFGRAQQGPAPGDGSERHGSPGRRGGAQRPDAAPETTPRGPGPGYQRTGQMSPDERRALRREIHDVGRDVYRPGTQR